MQKLSIKILISILLISLLTPSISMAEGLSDIDQSIYKVEIEKLIEDGIINGFSDGTYRPEDSITRAEFAKVLAISLKLDTSVKGNIQFEDVKGKWHEGYIGAVIESGLMIGTSDTTFTPDTNITREELSLILVRAFDLLEVAEKADLDITFIDQDDISTWAKKSVMLVNNIGLLEGIESEDGISFLPKRFEDRQIVAKLVYELLYNRDIYDLKIIELDINQDIDAESINSSTTTNKGDTKPEDNNQPTPKKLDDIISKYTKELGSVETIVQSDLDSLVSQAQDEYNDGGELYTLYKKYESLARELEADTDSKVSDIIADMEKELEDNGYDNSAASELYSEYETKKKEQEIKITL